MMLQLGNGLPSTLTPARIKAVLALAKSHERLLKDALDAESSPAWTATDSDGDLYERLRALITTVEGRATYEKARDDFENQKAKLVERADFFKRLIRVCFKEAPGNPKETDDGNDVERDPIQRLVQRLVAANAWDRVAEVLWADSLRRGDAERLLDALSRHPKLSPYLEEVQAGLTEQESDELDFASEEDGEASELVGRIRQMVANLDLDRLDDRELQDLSFDSWRLAKIAKARALHQKRVRSSLISQIEGWERKHAERLRNADAMATALKALKTRIEHGEADQNTVSDVLEATERFLSVNEEIKSLDSQRNEIRLSIDALVADPPSGQPGLQAPDAKRADTALEPATEESEPRAPESGAQIVEAVPGPGDRNQDDQESDNDLSSPSDDIAKDDEPTTHQVGVGYDHAAVVTEKREDHDARPIQSTNDAIKAAMEYNRLGIAYHLARCVPEAVLSADVIKLIACNYAKDKGPSKATQLSNLADALLNQARTPHAKASIPRLRDQAVLITCASLAPALDAPGGLVAQLLLSLNSHLGELPSLRALAKTAADVSMTGVDLPSSLLREDDTLDKWRDRVSAFRVKMTTWLANERQFKIRY